MTAQTAAQTAAAEPRSGSTITPTPQPNELAGFLAMQAAGTLPHVWSLKPDGSPVSPGAFNPSQGTPTWP
jgi:hypothetical protein